MLPVKQYQGYNRLTTDSLNTSTAMDFVKNLTGGGNNNANENQPQATGSEQKGEGGFLGGIGDKLNNAAGGGAQGEKNEDALDKGECPP